MDNIEFANRIIELRKEKGLSQKELGDMLGVSNKAVSKWENGESMPKTTTMLKLAEIFEIDGNELIGFEAKDSNSVKCGNAEIDKLKSENAILSSKLNAIKKRRKRTLIFVIIICVISVIASGIIAFCINTDKSVNSKITDAGNDGTKIVFADKEFSTGSDFSDYIISNSAKDNFYFSNEKNATFVDANGKEQKAVIECDSYTSFVKLTVKGKDYYYYDSELTSTIVNTKNVEFLKFYNNTITKDEFDEYYDDEYGSTIHSYYQADNNKAIFEFCKFYQNMGAPVDKKITKSFLGNEPRQASISFNDDFIYLYEVWELDLGEFFKDGKGNVYFYDYVTTNSYAVGEELINFVY